MSTCGYADAALQHRPNEPEHLYIANIGRNGRFAPPLAHLCVRQAVGTNT
jgi:hypothetical protein